MKINKTILILLLAIASMLRVWNIQNNPPSLSWDEVSIGYNAYSILKTGRDEHGRFLPLDTFIAYGDYKPPLPIYATVPFVALFGLNELSVRLPSAFFGIATIIIMYLLAMELFANSKFNGGNGAIFVSEKTSINIRKYLPLALVFVMTFSPWHINLSRAGFEANIALFFVVLGIYLLIRAEHNRSAYIYAWIPFIAAIYTFNSARYTVPFLALGLIIYKFRSVIGNIKYFLIGALVALVLLMPIIPHLFSKEARLRFTEVNIFSDIRIIQTSNERIEHSPNFIAKVFANRRVGYLYSFLIHYFDHFEPSFLFIRGDGNPKFSTQDVGQMYPIEAILLIIGVFGMLGQYPGVGMFILYWIIVSIIPAATARETPHALRIINSMPAWQLFIAYGLVLVVTFFMRLYIEKKKTQKFLSSVILLIFISIYIFQITRYVYNYHMHYPKKFAGEWQYGYKQAIQAVNQLTGISDSVLITNSIGRAYMYTLFYTSYDPTKYLAEKNSYFDAAGFYHVKNFGKYWFGDVLPKEINTGKPVAIVTASSKNLKNISSKTTIYLPDGTPILWVYRK